MEVDVVPAVVLETSTVKAEQETTRKQCIVVGCKNGNGGGDNIPNVRYFQVPCVATTNEPVNLHLTKQWYINTLREDLFDELIKNPTSQLLSQPHFVCIEHFDEDSFVDNNNSKDLKSDAVPSLFEIEVFQKMIVHQEKFAQQQQLMKQQLKEQQEKQAKFSLLTSLLSAGDSAANSVTNQQTAAVARPNSGGEKAAKAVKRTAVISAQKQQQLQQHKQQVESANAASVGGVRMGKALKHTQPVRFSSSNVILNDQTNQVENKAIKGGVDLTTNLKDLLPPPIIQSGRAKPIGNGQQTAASNLILPNGHKLSGVRQASLIASVQAPTSNAPSNREANTAANGAGSNKVTITTTYVYKKVTQEPEIELDMECEEEEIEYIKRPVIQPPKTVEPVEPEPAKSHRDEKKDRTKPRRDSTATKTDKPSNGEALKKRSHSQSGKTSSTAGFKAIFEKHYGRREGALQLSTMSSKTKKSFPYDLRLGNYPPKCNVCNIVLENNIELTSHICSHLETTGDIEQSTYISPFDAVTTMCSICELQFEHPFDLIKHLDLTHMKQLDEFKCRICEKQHVKLNELVHHLSKEHKVYEMPYRCDACGFRTSFYADAIFHIKKEHTNTLHHFCPYCLKSFILPYQKKLGHVECTLFYSHLQTHFNKQESNNMVKPSRCKHCAKCILHVRFMNEHLSYDHSSNLPPPPPQPEASRAASDHSIKSSKSATDVKDEQTVDTTKRKKITPATLVDEYDFESQENQQNQEEAGETKPKTIQKVQKAMKRPSGPRKAATVLSAQESAASGRKPRQRYRSTVGTVDNNSDLDEFDNDVDSSSSRTYLLGNNLRFTCSKDEFKCVECGHTDIKTHYKREYVCHQCYYNTSCSRSFEFHLHGHLNKKRTALWNKNVNSGYDEYSCPCGFQLSSTGKSSSIGNKIADHLNICEYKYCFCRTKPDSTAENESESGQNQVKRKEKEKSDESKPTVEKNSNNVDLHVSSEGIILNDSSDDV